MLFLRRKKTTTSLKLIFIFLTICISTIFQLKGQEINKTYTIDDIIINSTDEIDPNKFNESVFEEIIFDQINFLLEKRGFDIKQKNKTLIQAAKDQGTYMAFVESAKLIRDENVKTETPDRLKAYGGSGFGEELISKNNISSGNIPYTYAKIANDIVFKWFASSKTVKIFDTSYSCRHCNIFDI